MIIHNPFTIYLNTQFHVNEKKKIPLGIKSYYHSTNASRVRSEGSEAGVSVSYSEGRYRSPEEYEPIMFTNNDLILFIHGRVFNLLQLYEDIGSPENFANEDIWKVLLTIYKTYGIEYLLQVMQGEFVMVIVDQRVELDEAKIYAVSESMGIIPLYLSYQTLANKDRQYIISTAPLDKDDVNDFSSYTYPGTYAQFSLQRMVHASWTFEPRMNIHTYYSLSHVNNYMRHIIYDLPNVLNDQFYLSIWDRFQYDTTTTHVYCLDADNVAKTSDENSVRYVDRRSVRLPTVANLPDFQSGGEEFRRDVGSATEGRNLVRPKVVLRNVVETSSSEYKILYKALKKICERKNIILANNIPEKFCQTTRVFMVFDGCITDMYNDSNKTNLQIEYEFRNHLKKTVQTTLISLYESFYQEHGIMLEFPWMNSEWLQLYLSLSYSCRFDM